jgi:hypothetical protein
MEKSQTISELISGFDSNTRLTNSLYTVSEPQKKSAVKSDDTSSSLKSSGKNETSVSKTKNIGPTENSYKPVVLNSVEIEDVVSTWQNLIDAIKQERALLLGGLISNLQVIEFDGQHLTLSTPSPEVLTDLTLHKEYLDKKIYEIFGKKINLRFGDVKSVKTEEKLKKTRKKNDVDPIEKLIIEELGGKEIA